MAENNGSRDGKSPSGEVPPKARRRTFTRAYKLAIVREAAEARKTGGVGANVPGVCPGWSAAGSSDLATGGGWGHRGGGYGRGQAWPPSDHAQGW